MAGILSFLSSLRVHQLTFRGVCYCWWLWHPLLTDMAGNIPFLRSLPSMQNSNTLPGPSRLYLVEPCSLPWPHLLPTLVFLGHNQIRLSLALWNLPLFFPCPGMLLPTCPSSSLHSIIRSLLSSYIQEVFSDHHHHFWFPYPDLLFVVHLSLYTCTSIDGFIIFGYSLSSPQEYKLQRAGVLSVSFTGVSSMPLTVFITYLVNEKGIFVDKIIFLKAPILLPTLEALIGIWGARALSDKGMEGWICVLPSW